MAGGALLLVLRQQGHARSARTVVGLRPMRERGSRKAERDVSPAA
jgi:hypothetical protein